MAFLYFSAIGFHGQDARFFAVRPKVEEVPGNFGELFIARGLAQIGMRAQTESVLHIAAIG